jgi:methionyl-tRNA formyltransferase
MTYVICAYREYSLELYKKLKDKYDFKLIKNPEKLNIKNIKKINPKYIFFPDWSWIVPKEIYKNYQCVCFHESNLPKFRGGSPLQNQIIRNVLETKTTAFMMNDILDGGDILLQKKLSLKGNIDDIFERMLKNDHEMIVKIIKNGFSLKKQKGKPICYKRRKPNESELNNLDHSKKYLYNFIRMLGDPYPNAYIEIGKRKIIFKSAKYQKDKLVFEGEIQ